MEITFFYAWQGDTPSQFNRTLIRNSLEGATKSIRSDAAVEESPRLDNDTRGVSGTPEIASTIFDKIKRCAVFVADVTFAGEGFSTASNGERKLLPNPNVMLELGFASATVGWERIITVMNEHYGPAERQVFDLKSRRFPIRYTAAPESTDDLGEAKRQLRTSLEQAIRLALRSRFEAIEEIIRSLDAECLRILRMSAQHSVFWRHPDNTVIQNVAMDAAYRHLLGLRLISGTLALDGEKYEYRWTYLGIQTLIQLGLRQQP